MPSRQTVEEWLRRLAMDEETRPSAAAWAREMLARQDTNDAEVEQGLVALSAADAEVPGGGYIYELVDFELWLEELTSQD